MAQNSKKARFSLTKLGLRARILAVFVIACSASLLSISALSAAFFGGAGATSSQQSTAALQSQIQRNMGKSAVENAGIINSKLTDAATQVELLAAHAKTLFDYPGAYGYRPSYYHALSASPTPPTPPGYYYDSTKYGQFVSRDVSSYFITTGNYTGSYTSVSGAMNDTIKTSASMDYLFQNVLEAFPEFHWLYMGFQIGMHRTYPWHLISNPAYDPTTRTWYKTAKANPGSIIYTAPYFDASGGGLMISIARTVSKADGTFIGVVSADLTISTVRQQVLDIHLTTSGYAFLMSAAGKLVAHPNSTVPTDTIQSLEPNLPQSIINEMSAMASGFGTFTKAGVTHYIAYAPVASCNYSVAVIVPEAEAIGIVDELGANIALATMSISTLNMIIVIIATVFAVVLGLLIASKLVDPVNMLVKYASRLATMDVRKSQIKPDEFKIDDRLETQSDEIGDLTRAFKAMVVSLQKEKDNPPSSKRTD